MIIYYDLLPSYLYAYLILAMRQYSKVEHNYVAKVLYRKQGLLIRGTSMGTWGLSCYLKYKIPPVSPYKFYEKLIQSSAPSNKFIML